MSLEQGGRVPLPGARVDAEQVGGSVTVTAYLRSSHGRHPADDAAALARTPVRARLHERMSVADLAERYGPDPEVVRDVVRLAAESGLTADSALAAARSVRVRGPAAELARFFGVSGLAEYVRGTERYRGRVGALAPSERLGASLDAVLGLDDRRVAGPDVIRSHAVDDLLGGRDAVSAQAAPGPHVIRSHVIRSHVIRSHVIPSHDTTSAAAAQRSVSPTAAGRGFDVRELEELYEFPPATTGAGQRIGVVALTSGRGPDGERLCGGYDRSLLAQGFADVGLPLPRITDVLVDEQRDANRPGDGRSSHDVTAEVMLDLQVAGALAPGADFVVYFSESSEQGLTDAVWRAVTDEDNDISVLLICYGSPEGAEDGALWTGMCVDELDRALAAAALRGITVVTSCGDNGGAGAPWSTRVHADFPAASPWVLSCGGTRVDRFRRETHGADGASEAVWLETVWNDGRGASGGGVSRLVARPPWQAAADLPASADWAAYAGRGVPDVAALADPATGVLVRDPEGRRVLSGGTSVAAPVWAALVARLAEALGPRARLGLLAPQLYQLLGTNAFTDVMLGDNGPYRARRGWDPCTGLGTPRGTRLLAALR